MSHRPFSVSLELWNELVPFSLCFDQEGNLKWASDRILEIWETSLDSIDRIAGQLNMQRPFEGKFKGEWLPELTDVVVHLTFDGCPERVIRGQFYPCGDEWIFTGCPYVTTIEEVEAMGMELHRFPLHMAAGELLISNEATKAAYRDTVKQSEKLKVANVEQQDTLRQLSNFVPERFIENLGVDSALSVEPGLHDQSHKAVIFADLRRFTTMSEAVGARKVFTIINEYIKCTVPCIHANDGYVVSYLGDGILAVFPGNSLSAARAAIQMQEAFKETFRDRDDLPFPLELSIGIHDGPVMLGILGHESRWDVSIIADAVNTSSRIEAMTRVLGGEIIVSRPFLKNAGDFSELSLRDLGQHDLRGRKGSLGLVEILDSLDQEALSLREKTTKDFEAGIAAYQSHEFYIAMSCFSRVLAKFPEDGASRFYLDLVSKEISKRNR